MRVQRLTRANFVEEPFRLFFPLAVLSGLAGALLWPLHFGGLVANYPGVNHARIMAHSFFGGFIFGFLGTALPRMLSAPRFKTLEVILLATLNLAMTACYLCNHVFLGDALLLAVVSSFIFFALRRLSHRQDLPPPGFLLVGASFLCLVGGTAIALVSQKTEIAAHWQTLQRLLSYQGFVLLPILGVGAFILPRFFGLPNKQDLPESLRPTMAWKSKAAFAAFTGLGIIGSFFIEAFGWYRTGVALRLILTTVYLFRELPLHLANRQANAITLSLKAALFLVLAGFTAILIWPEYRVSLLHLTLIGGFAVITFCVATRVIFGHSGQLQRVSDRNIWLLVAVGLILLGAATRISGDFWPKIMASHYNYGAYLWAAGLLLWGWKVLPNVLRPDLEE